jgi:hypothetical protein
VSVKGFKNERVCEAKQIKTENKKQQKKTQS